MFKPVLAVMTFLRYLLDKDIYFSFVYLIKILHLFISFNLDILVGYQIFTFLIRPRYQSSQIFVIYLLVGC
jgi:hypothetical protein